MYSPFSTPQALASQKQSTRSRRRSIIEALEPRQMMAADIGGNTISSAANIGTLDGSRIVSDWVGLADPNDFMRIQVPQQSYVQFGLSGLRADADLQLLDSSGRSIAYSARGGSNSEAINEDLPAGTYYVRVYRFSGDTNYTLTMNATPRQPNVQDNAGNSRDTARNVGVLSGERIYSDAVGSQDRDDFYRFQVTGRSSFELQLDGVTSDADVQLQDVNGRTIESSTRAGSESESIRVT